MKIKDFNPNLLKIDKNSYKSINIYYIGYISMKDFEYVKINSVNPLYLIIVKGDEYIEESSGDKYLSLVSTDKNKKILIKYTKHSDGIKYLIKTINGGETDEYEKEYMKIKFNSDDNLPLKLQTEPYLCNARINLMHKAMNFNDVSIVSVKGSDYETHFCYMSGDDAINIMKNSHLNEKSGLL